MEDSIGTIEYEATPLGFFTMLARLVEAGNPPPASIKPRRHASARVQAELFPSGAVDDPWHRARLSLFIPANGNAAASLVGRLQSSDRMIVDILDFAFRSERPIEAEALCAVRLALAGKAQALRDEGRHELRSLRLAWRYALRELDRFRGILRFERGADGVWEAVCEPEADILDLLPPHFEARLGGEAFRIRDQRRGRTVSGGSRPSAPEGLDAVGLWKRYYRVIENEGRHNEGLRKQFLPARYWRHLPELFHGDSAENRCRPPGSPPDPLP